MPDQVLPWAPRVGVEQWEGRKLDWWSSWAFSQGDGEVMAGSEQGRDKVRFIL